MRIALFQGADGWPLFASPIRPDLKNQGHPIHLPHLGGVVPAAQRPPCCHRSLPSRGQSHGGAVPLPPRGCAVRPLSLRRGGGAPRLGPATRKLNGCSPAQAVLISPGQFRPSLTKIFFSLTEQFEKALRSAGSSMTKNKTWSHGCRLGPPCPVVAARMVFMCRESHVPFLASLYIRVVGHTERPSVARAVQHASSPVVAADDPVRDTCRSACQ
jgi:hypothetical protein